MVSTNPHVLLNIHDAKWIADVQSYFLILTPLAANIHQFCPCSGPQKGRTITSGTISHFVSIGFDQLISIDWGY